MDDVLRVRSIERVGDLSAVFQRLIERQRSCEWRAVDVLHDEVVRADVVEGADVRMVQRRDCPRFPLEPLAEIRTRHF